MVNEIMWVVLITRPLWGSVTLDKYLLPPTPQMTVIRNETWKHDIHFILSILLSVILWYYSHIFLWYLLLFYFFCCNKICKMRYFNGKFLKRMQCYYNSVKCASISDISRDISKFCCNFNELFFVKIPTYSKIFIYIF